MVVGYCRVGLNCKSDLLKEKAAKMEAHMVSVLPSDTNTKVISDVGFSIDYKRKGFLELVSLIFNKKISALYLFNGWNDMDRGFEIVSELCRLADIDIIEIDKKS